jgi:hypothetical protein
MTALFRILLDTRDRCCTGDAIQRIISLGTHNLPRIQRVSSYF